jgi:excisionase family DNA binding protein
MTSERASAEQLLTPADVAARVFVDPKTVSRWARAGKIPSQRTPGGHRRFRSSDVDTLVNDGHTRHNSDGDPMTPVPDDGTHSALPPAGPWPTRSGERDEAADPPSARRTAADVEAIAVALEAQAGRAAELVRESAASVAVAAETAAAAATRARQARALASAEAAQVHTPRAARSASATLGAAAIQTAAVADAAAEATRYVASSSADAHAALAQVRQMAAEQAATAGASADTSAAAARVARTVDDAAAHLSALVIAFDLAVDEETAAAADALHEMMLHTTRDAAPAQEHQA